MKVWIPNKNKYITKEEEVLFKYGYYVDEEDNKTTIYKNLFCGFPHLIVDRHNLTYILEFPVKNDIKLANDIMNVIEVGMNFTSEFINNRQNEFLSFLSLEERKKIKRR